MTRMLNLLSIPARREYQQEWHDVDQERRELCMLPPWDQLQAKCREHQLPLQVSIYEET